MATRDDNGINKIVLKRGDLKLLAADAGCEKPYASQCISGKYPFSKRCKEVRAIALDKHDGKFQRLS